MSTLVTSSMGTQSDSEYEVTSAPLNKVPNMIGPLVSSMGTQSDSEVEEFKQNPSTLNPKAFKTQFRPIDMKTTSKGVRGGLRCHSDSKILESQRARILSDFEEQSAKFSTALEEGKLSENLRDETPSKTANDLKGEVSAQVPLKKDSGVQVNLAKDQDKSNFSWGNFDSSKNKSPLTLKVKTSSSGNCENHLSGSDEMMITLDLNV